MESNMELLTFTLTFFARLASAALYIRRRLVASLICFFALLLQTIITLITLMRKRIKRAAAGRKTVRKTAY